MTKNLINTAKNQTSGLLMSADEELFTRDKVRAIEIVNALEKYAGIERDSIRVTVHNDAVILDGWVSTLSQKENVEDIAYSLVNGIVKVDNNLKVDVEYAGADIYEY